MSSRLVCRGCGARALDPSPFRCPGARPGDDVDHVVCRELDGDGFGFPLDDPEPNPFVRYRRLLHAYGLGLRDEEFLALVARLDRRVVEVDGHGFRVTPFAREPALSDALGFSAAGGVWVKDETGNVSGSHKARHLFDVLLYLEATERIGLAPRRDELAIASCGNAALAAAVLAAAGERTLHVFVPVDADVAVLERLEELGALVEVCPRQRGEHGDPTVRRLLDALDAGALPFTCQGSLNGLAVEGGETLGWELVSSGVPIDRLLVQVGGGALASACIHAYNDAIALGAPLWLPQFDTVQTEGAWPLKRAFDAVAARGAGGLAYAAQHRSEFMWPWEEEPHSLAHGILDDETYDWLAVVEGMVGTGGAPVVVGEDAIARAHSLGRETTGIDADPTGTAGLAGLLALRDAGEIDDDERVAVLFTGATRQTERTRDEELSRSRHPVAEGVRAR